MTAEVSSAIEGRARPARPGTAARRAPVAQWRPVSAVAAVAVGVVLGLAAGAAVVIASGHARGAAGLSIIVSDLVLVAVVVVAAARGAERLGATTLAIRRTAFWPAVGWGSAILAGAWAVDGLLAVFFGGGGRHHHDVPHPALGVAILVTLGIAVTTPIVEEIAFRGYLFPALTRWRGPWIAAVITALLFGAAHVLALPPAFLPGAAAFGFGACLLLWFTGSLLPGIVVHSLNNAIVLALATGGRLWWAIFLAPLASMAILRPLARTRAPQNL